MAGQCVRDFLIFIRALNTVYILVLSCMSGNILLRRLFSVQRAIIFNFQLNILLCYDTGTARVINMDTAALEYISNLREITINWTFDSLIGVCIPTYNFNFQSKSN